MLAADGIEVLAAADQEPGDQTNGSGDADGLPRFFADKFIRALGSFAAALHRLLLDLHPLFLALFKSVLHAIASGFKLTRGCVETVFRILANLI